MKTMVNYLRCHLPIWGQMLAALSLPLLSALPAAAQFLPSSTTTSGSVEMVQFIGPGFKSTLHVMVLDYANATDYTTGMPGQTMAAAMILELRKSKDFDAVDPDDVNKALQGHNITTPFTTALSDDLQAVLAEELKCDFCISGTIQSIVIHKAKGGATYAEVKVDTLMINRVTRLPINGASVTATSSHKINYAGNTDVLVNEAFDNIAVQTALQLRNREVPMATVMTRDDSTGSVMLHGGTSIGLHNGMELVTLRKGNPTGRLHLTEVNPGDSTATVIEDYQGVATGDSAVPIFNLESPQPEKVSVNAPVFTSNKGAAKTPKVSFDDDSGNGGRIGQQLLALGALALLVVLVGTNGGSKQLQYPGAPTAYAVSDAASQGYPNGAIKVTWPAGPSDRMAAYLLYRDTNIAAPIAVLPPGITTYIDSDRTTSGVLPVGMLMASTEYQIIINPTQPDGPVELQPSAPTYDANLDAEQDPGTGLQNITYGNVTQLEVYSRWVPLKAGDACGYMVQYIYKDFTKPDISGAPIGIQGYQLVLGYQGKVSTRIPFISPPNLKSPVDGQQPDGGFFRCDYVDTAEQYQLQLCPYSDFNQSSRVTYDAGSNGDYIEAQVNLADLQNNPRFSGNTVFWRFVVKVPNGTPAQPMGSSDANLNGLVVSQYRHFTLSAVPPSPTMIRSKGVNQAGGLPGPFPTSQPSRGRNRWW